MSPQKQLEKDAARYRFLRSPESREIPGQPAIRRALLVARVDWAKNLGPKRGKQPNFWSHENIESEAMDREVDRQMRKSKEPHP